MRSIILSPHSTPFLPSLSPSSIWSPSTSSFPPLALSPPLRTTSKPSKKRRDSRRRLTTRKFIPRPPLAPSIDGLSFVDRKGIMRECNEVEGKAVVEFDEEAFGNWRVGGGWDTSESEQEGEKEWEVLAREIEGWWDAGEMV